MLFKRKATFNFANIFQCSRISIHTTHAGSDGQIHIVRGKSNKEINNINARNLTLSNFKDVINAAMVVEVTDNKKNKNHK